MDLTSIKHDLTIYGVINIILYICGSFLSIPFMSKYLKLDRPLLHYVYYSCSGLSLIYVLFILNKKPEERNHVQKVIYNWFIKGGLSSYQDVFLLFTKNEPFTPLVLLMPLFMVLLMIIIYMSIFI